MAARTATIVATVSPGPSHRRGGRHDFFALRRFAEATLCIITPAGFEGFFEEIGAMSPQQQQDIPRVIEIGKKYGLEILPPPGA